MRFELPADKVLTHRMTIPVRWGDMDAMGHVNNATYFRYLETVRIAWFDALGCPPAVRDEGPLIVNAFCSFIRQIEYPAVLDVRHWCGALGRSSLDTYVTLALAERPDEICAEGGATVVWTRYAERKSAPIPDALRTAMLRPWRPQA